MYKAFIFDLGNVLLNISYPRILAYWSEATGQKLDDLQGIKSKMDEEEVLFEVGAISAADFRSNLAAKIGFKIADTEFDNGWNNIFKGINPGIEAVLKQLKHNYRLVGLSNTNLIHAINAIRWRKEYPAVTAYFERFFCSYEIGKRKPDAAAFQIVLDYLQLPPEQVVFIDDNLVNIEGAVKMGITGIMMRSVAQLTRDLNQIGVKLVYQQHTYQRI